MPPRQAASAADFLVSFKILGCMAVHQHRQRTTSPVRPDETTRGSSNRAVRVCAEREDAGIIAPIIDDDCSYAKQCGNHVDGLRSEQPADCAWTFHITSDMCTCALLLGCGRDHLDHDSRDRPRTGSSKSQCFGRRHTHCILLLRTGTEHGMSSGG